MTTKEDLKPQDLGNGFMLKFQFPKGSSDQVRAIVIDDKGEIVARGSVVPVYAAKSSQFQAITDWSKEYGVLKPPPPPEPEEEEAYDDEDDEDEEEDDEYL